MKLFQAVMYASSEEELQIAKDLIVKEADNYPLFVNRFEKFFERKNEWVFMYRQDIITRGHNTNNFAEATICILKDVILCRTKAFNVVALADFCVVVLEEYLKVQLMDFANNRRYVKLLYSKLSSRMGDIPSESIAEIDPSTYRVPSFSDCNVFYTVNVDSGICTCKFGELGAFCKHQYLLFDKLKLNLPNIPIINSTERFKLGQLTLGGKCPDHNFFLGFKENTKKSTVPADNSFDLIDNETDLIQINSSEPSNVLSNSVYTDNSPTDEEKKEFLEATQNIINSDIPKSILLKLTKQFKLVQKRGTMKNRRERIIKVQPTSLARRRVGVTRGSTRIPAGRPVKTNLKKVLKRRRSLANAIKRNTPNAKSHGANH